jgi:hypothetical protein
MALGDPVAVYCPANNVEANLVKLALINSGVQAFVTEALPEAQGWLLGTLTDIDRPQVWVDRADIERAKPILAEYERRASEHGDAASGDAAAGPPIEVVCEECGQRSSFLPAQRGSVQVCPHCNAYVDIGGDEVPEDWTQPPEDQVREVQP